MSEADGAEPAAERAGGAREASVAAAAPVTWPRPVPTVGDRTSAAQRRADPQGWAFSPRDRAALLAVIAARRDVRRFRPDAVAPDVVTRVLTAGHQAPSVGLSQPWRFLLVTEAETRERAAVMADRERLRQAGLLTPEAGRRLLDLQLEGLREAPLGIVVCCDRRTPAAGVLGRATFADADLWSCACAVQNMWLAARAEGLGLGWVTLFDPEELSALLDLPDGVETLGWLCLGWPDERPPDPGLERTAWATRAPLSAVTLRERWSESPAPRSHLRAPTPNAVVAARDDDDVRLRSPGSLGVLDRSVDRLEALQTSATGTLVLVGADHPIAAQGVSTWSPRVTRDVMDAAVAGTALGVVTARGCGLSVHVVDAGVDPGPVRGAVPARPRHARGDLVTTDAMDRRDVDQLIADGTQIGCTLAGIVALGEVGIGNTTVAAALATLQLGTDDDLIGVGAGSDSATLERKRGIVAAAVARTGHLVDPVDQLAAVGGPEIAVLVGVILGAAGQGALVVLDGLATTTAAVVATTLQPGIQAHLVAGQRSRETAHPRLLDHLGLEPLLDLRLRAGEGVGACLATQLITTAARARERTARTD